MVITELLGKRVLLKTGHYSTVDEFKVLEVSPSGQWVKLMNLHGSRFWKPIHDLALVEILVPPTTEPKPAE